MIRYGNTIPVQAGLPFLGIFPDSLFPWWFVAHSLYVWKWLQ